ncbi:MAG: hypothetical protein HFH49_10705 [Lachnospiraceae bacterium]|nr:hypothetical protein [Lachnospiraceae bacterium]
MRNQFPVNVEAFQKGTNERTDANPVRNQFPVNVEAFQKGTGEGTPTL